MYSTLGIGNREILLRSREAAMNQVLKGSRDRKRRQSITRFIYVFSPGFRPSLSLIVIPISSFQEAS
jgi:hypothetical protein